MAEQLAYTVGISDCERQLWELDLLVGSQHRNRGTGNVGFEETVILVEQLTNMVVECQ